MSPDDQHSAFGGKEHHDKVSAGIAKVVRSMLKHGHAGLETMIVSGLMRNLALERMLERRTMLLSTRISEFEDRLARGNGPKRRATGRAVAAANGHDEKGGRGGHAET